MVVTGELVHLTLQGLVLLLQKLKQVRGKHLDFIFNSDRDVNIVMKREVKA